MVAKRTFAHMQQFQKRHWRYWLFIPQKVSEFCISSSTIIILLAQFSNQLVLKSKLLLSVLSWKTTRNPATVHLLATPRTTSRLFSQEQETTPPTSSSVFTTPQTCTQSWLKCWDTTGISSYQIWVDPWAFYWDYRLLEQFLWPKNSLVLWWR